MKRTIAGISKAGEQLIQQAIDAMRKYREAQDYGAPPVEVERLRLRAESLLEAVSDYQSRVIARARGKNLPPFALGAVCGASEIYRIQPPPAPPLCSPTCSHGLMNERESWRKRMTEP